MAVARLQALVEEQKATIAKLKNDNKALMAEVKALKKKKKGGVRFGAGPPQKSLPPGPLQGLFAGLLVCLLCGPVNVQLVPSRMYTIKEGATHAHTKNQRR